MDGEVEIACVGVGVEVDVGQARDLAPDYRRHHIARVAVVDAVHYHLSAQCHLSVVALRVVVSPGAETLHLDHDFQGLGETVLVGEVDDFGIYAHGQGRSKREADGDDLLGVDGAVGLAGMQPVGEAVDGVLVALAADVVDVGREDVVVVFVFVEHTLQTIGVPGEHVLVDIDLPHGGANGAVAVEVLHVADGDEDIVFVDFAVGHVDVDEELVLVVAPVEAHLGEQTALADGGNVGVGGEERGQRVLRGG